MARKAAKEQRKEEKKKDKKSNEHRGKVANKILLCTRRLKIQIRFGRDAVWQRDKAPLLLFWRRRMRSA